MNQVSECQYLGKKFHVTYVLNRRCHLLSINNRLHPKHFKTELEAITEAYRTISEEEKAGL